nr:protein-glutamate O-methyltransferase CheR [Bacteroidota bacterium]
AKYNEELRKPMAFALHNLGSDQSFNEFHLIVCRNVLIYFNKKLQDRVLNLFLASLAEDGFLALGSKESVRFATSSDYFSQINKDEKIWQKSQKI